MHQAMPVNSSLLPPHPSGQRLCEVDVGGCVDLGRVISVHVILFRPSNLQEFFPPPSLHQSIHSLSC